MTLLRRLVLFGGFNVGHGVVSTLAVAITAGLLYRRLGVDYGLLALITGGMLRLNLVDDSLGSYVVTLLARQRGTGAPGEEAPGPARPHHVRQLGLAVRLYVGLSVVFALVFAVAVAVLLLDRPDVLALSTLAGLGLLLATLANLLAKLLEGAEAYPPLRLTQSSVALVRLGAVAWLFVAGARALAVYVALFAASYLLLLMLLGILVRRRRISLSSGPGGRFQPGDLRHVGSFVRPLLVAKGASAVSYRLDLWVVQVLAGPAATAAYAMAEAVAGLAAQALEVLKALLPVSVRDWRRDPEWLRTLALDTSKLSLLVVGGACAVGFASLEPLLGLWFGEAPGLAVLAGQLLLSFYALTSFRSPVQLVLTGQGLFHHLERHFLAAAGLNFVVSVAATWAWGGWGAALGTLVSGVYLLVANLAAAESALGLPSRLLGRRVVLPGLVALGAAAFSTTGWAGREGLDSLVVRAAVSGLIFLLLFASLVLTSRDRSRTLALLTGGAP